MYRVGLRCPLEELERREAARGDRGNGDARRDARTVHTFCAYDLEIDCGSPVRDNVARVIGGWQARTGAGVWGTGGGRG